jgi:CRISPR-associated protein Csc3
MEEEKELESFDVGDNEAEKSTPAASSAREVSPLSAEPLFAALLRRAVKAVWGDDPVMDDFVKYVAMPLSDHLGHESAKGGNFAKDMAELGKDSARYSFDQSMRAHLINGLFPALHVAKTLREWGAPQLRHYDDTTRRVFIAGFILHDWLKLPGVEDELKAAGFSHADSIGPAQLPTVEALFAAWAARLGLTDFLAPVGSPAELAHDLIFVACNTQIRWGTLRNLRVLPRLKLNADRRELCTSLSRLADYLTYIARRPRDVAADRSIRNLISDLSDRAAYFTYHHLAENRGVLTNFIHSAVLKTLRDEARVPLLYAPSGVVYLTRKDAPPPPPTPTLIEKVIGTIKRKIGQRLAAETKGFKRGNVGIKYADYYWLFFDLYSFVEHVTTAATFKIIHDGKQAVAGARAAAIGTNPELPEGIDLNLPDDRRVDQLAEWCHLVEKTVASKYPKFDTTDFLLTQMELPDPIKAHFEAVPCTGGVGYSWYFAAGHYLKGPGRGLDPTAWRERIESFAHNLAAALPRPDPTFAQDDSWGDLRTYIGQVLSISEAGANGNGHDPFAAELDRYQNAKRKGRGSTKSCAMCSSSFEVGEQMETAILFPPQVYSNRLALHGSKAKRDICAICGLETMLRQLLMNRTNASGGDFEGRKVRYLYFYPTYFFTPETLEIIRLMTTTLKRPSFVDLRKHFVTSEGWDNSLNLEPTTLQRLEPFLLEPPDPDKDPYMRFREGEPAAFNFIGIPPPGRDAKDAEAWIHPAFLALLLPLCLDVKVVASESAVPLLVEADELPETVFLDGAHAFVGYVAAQKEGHLRLNIDEVLPTLQRLIVAYLIQMDANSGMGRGGFDYRWQNMPAVARDLASSPLYAFHYLKKWQREAGLDSLPVGKARLYLNYAENHLTPTSIDERRLSMTHARNLTTLYRRFYRAKGYKSHNIQRPLKEAAKVILEADPRLFTDDEALIEVVFGNLRRRITQLKKEKLAFYPKAIIREEWEEAMQQLATQEEKKKYLASCIVKEREDAMREFAAYMVNEIYRGALRGDRSALRGKQYNLLSSACEAIYRDERAKDIAELNQIEADEEDTE